MTNRFRPAGLQPKGTIVLPFGAYTAQITGGPFAYAEQLPVDFVTVKLAAEIKADCDVDLPIRDFSTPNAAQAEQALRSVLYSIHKGHPIYVGCMAGQGRTGLFLALLVKVAHDYSRASGAPVAATFTGPVEYVRENYYPHAVETAGQYAFVDGFDTEALLQYVTELQPVPVAPTFGFALGRLAASAVGLFRAIAAAGRAVLTGRA